MMIFNINSTRGQTRFLTCVARVTCLVLIMYTSCQIFFFFFFVSLFDFLVSSSFLSSLSSSFSCTYSSSPFPLLLFFVISVLSTTFDECSWLIVPIMFVPITLPATIDELMDYVCCDESCYVLVSVAKVIVSGNKSDTRLGASL